MDAVAERVARGTAYLDKVEPGWWRKIDLGELDMEAECRCVLGQLYTDRLDEVPGKNWVIILNEFGVGNYWATDKEPVDDVNLGFNALWGEFPELQSEWVTVIAGRRMKVIEGAGFDSTVQEVW